MNLHTSLRLVAIAAGLSVAAPALAAFNDVPWTHPHSEAVNYLHVKGIISGYSDGTFRASNKINRAEFTKIIMGAIANKNDIDTCDGGVLTYFDDVETDIWYAPFVCFARQKGVVQGHIVSNGKPRFSPEENISFVEAAKIITSAMNIGEPPLDCSADYGRLCYEAAQRGDIWYKRHVDALQQKDAIPSSIAHITQSITRGEMAEMIFRVMESDSLNEPQSQSSTAFKFEFVQPASSSSKKAVSSSAPQNVRTEADLSVEAEGPWSLEKGDVFVVTFTVTNHGPDASENVVLMSSFNRSDFDAATSDGRCKTNTNSVYNIVCSLGTLESGDSTTVTIGEKTNRFLCPNELTLHGSTDADTRDPEPMNDADYFSTALECPAAEEVNLRGEIIGPSNFTDGDSTELSYIVHNSADVTAYSVSARITIPEGLTFNADASPSSCAVMNSDVICSFGHILGQSEVRKDLVFDVDCSASPVETTMSISTISQNKFNLQPITMSMGCYGQ